MVQKQISKSLSPSFSLAEFYHSESNRSQREKISNFLRYGSKDNIIVGLDNLLLLALQTLSPFYRHFTLFSVEGEMWRQVDDSYQVAGVIDAAATLLQCMCRRRIAWKKVTGMLATQREIEKEKQRVFDASHSALHAMHQRQQQDHHHQSSAINSKA